MLSESALPKLWLPKQDNFHAVDALPVLGTGKLDIRQAKALARDLSA
jgi:acyl-[acyl-carrier-protein]-phospholipid O-acyltransferase/long-chain-fatty-acid--[acyl-carrier-protein] ligase